MSEWISVQDRMPPYGPDFLACDAEQSWIGVAWKNKTLNAYQYTGGEILRHFTHWMPLPAPPDSKEPTR